MINVNRKERRTDGAFRQPLYTADDVRAIVRQFVGVRYGDVVSPMRGMKATFHDAGHILGSAAISLRITKAGGTKVILFSGDLGRRQMPILRDPQPPPPCDILIIESTYGDRTHGETAEEATQRACALIEHAIAHRSKIIVPAFAVGRTQDIVMWMKDMVKKGQVPPIPMYIDSPLALRATEIFRRHPECYDEDTYRILTTEGDPFIAKYIRYVSSVQESQKLNTMKGPCIIIAASGMCEGGRVLHHLRHAIGDDANIVAIVGFQAEHTLGRKLVEGWDTVPIFGLPVPRRARVVRFNGLSAHGDREDLLAYLRAIKPLPRQVFIVHGEERQAFSLAAAMRLEHSGLNVTVPEPGNAYDL